MSCEQIKTHTAHSKCINMCILSTLVYNIILIFYFTKFLLSAFCCAKLRYNVYLTWDEKFVRKIKSMYQSTLCDRRLVILRYHCGMLCLLINNQNVVVEDMSMWRVWLRPCQCNSLSQRDWEICYHGCNCIVRNLNWMFIKHVSMPIGAVMYYALNMNIHNSCCNIST